MKCRIEYLSTFYSDIQSIINYLEDFPNKATRIFSIADVRINYLETMPEMYPIYPDVPDFRFIVIEDYIVFYKYIKDSNLAEIHRFLSGRMDIPNRVNE